MEAAYSPTYKDFIVVREDAGGDAVAELGRQGEERGSLHRLVHIRREVGVVGECDDSWCVGDGHFGKGQIVACGVVDVHLLSPFSVGILLPVDRLSRVSEAVGGVLRRVLWTSLQLSNGSLRLCM